MAIVLELCRHPASDHQVALVDEYGTALDVGGDELESVHAQVDENAAAATDDFIRRFDQHVVELSEFEFTHPDQGRSDEELWNEVHSLDRHPPGTLGSEYIEFHRRNGFDLPGPTTPSPTYYVSHDMNHVITGYEPTGRGEIALGAFKLSMNDSEANWMASMANVLIHEAGLIKHGSSAQFVPFGGAPYPGPDGQFGALSVPGMTDLVAEAFARGRGLCVRLQSGRPSVDGPSPPRGSTRALSRDAAGPVDADGRDPGSVAVGRPTPVS
jgi:hypothetical protein